MACSHEILQTFEEYIKSVKTILGEKRKKSTPGAAMAGKVSSDSSNNASRQLSVDEHQLKERAKTKQIKIFDSQIKAKKMHERDTRVGASEMETTGTAGPN